MKTSLIGKALNFGFNEYRFESYVFNFIKIYSLFFLSLISSIRKKQSFFFSPFSKKLIKLAIILAERGLISFFSILNFYKKSFCIKFISFSLLLINGLPLFFNIKLFPKKSLKFFIKKNIYKIISINSQNSILLVSSNINSFSLLKSGSSGVLKAIVS